MESLRDLIEVRRGEVGLSVKDFLDQLELSQNGWYKMLSNDSIKLKTLYRISEILNVSIIYWFTNKSSEYENTTNVGDTTSVVSEPSPSFFKKVTGKNSICSSCVLMHQLEANLDYIDLLKKELARLKDNASK